jgi:hypothetical protein
MPLNRLYTGTVKAFSISGHEWSDDSKWSIEVTEWMDESGIDIFLGEKTPVSLSKEQLAALIVSAQIAGIIDDELIEKTRQKLED